jgi:hypothetical protein
VNALPGARLSVAGFVLATVVAAGAGRAAAAPCPLPPGADARLGDFDGGLRLAWIDERLTRTAYRTRLWRDSITVGLVAATFANLAPVPFIAPDNRVDWYTGSATTVAGVVPLYVEPLEILDDAPEVAAADATARAGVADVCHLLSDAEARFVRDAASQAASQRWWWHAGNFALNAGVGLFLGIGFHHWLAGAFNFASGAAIGEAIILTQPTDSVGDLARYRRGDLVLGAPAVTMLRFGGRF